MNFETIKYEVENKILTLTLNRPDKLNAFTGQMMDELISAFDKAGKDDDVRVITLQVRAGASVLEQIYLLDLILLIEM